VEVGEIKNINNNFDLKFEKVNDAKYIVKLNNNNQQQTKLIISLNTTFSNFWVAKCVNCKNNYKFKNELKNFYTNIFEADIEKNDREFIVELYFLPEKYTNFILIFCLSLILISLLFFLKINFINKR
jgi:hypothetical protein